jgi:hypothetical protein
MQRSCERLFFLLWFMDTAEENKFTNLLRYGSQPNAAGDMGTAVIAGTSEGENSDPAGDQPRLSSTGFDSMHRVSTLTLACFAAGVIMRGEDGLRGRGIALMSPAATARAVLTRS